jgi:hypothetical protein
VLPKLKTAVTSHWTLLGLPNLKTAVTSNWTLLVLPKLKTAVTSNWTLLVLPKLKTAVTSHWTLLFFELPSKQTACHTETYFDAGQLVPVAEIKVCVCLTL